MSDDAPDVPGPPETPPPKGGQKVPQGMILEDKRKPWFISMPHYVIKDFAPLIGPYALVTYIGLCYRVGRTRKVWPSYATVAADLGISRSSVERSMRILKQHGLVLVVPRIDGRGQHSNHIYLVDPGTTLEDLELLPPPPVAPPTPPTAPAPPDSTPPPVTETVRAPSNRRRAAEVSSGSDTSEEGEAPPPEVSPQQEEQAHRLTDAWMQDLLCSAPQLRREHKREIHLALIDLLRRGYNPDQLHDAIKDSDRDKAEWPRLWRARVLASKDETARRLKAQAESMARERAKAIPADKNALLKAQRIGGLAAAARMKAAGVEVEEMFSMMDDGRPLPQKG